MIQRMNKFILLPEVFMKEEIQTAYSLFSKYHWPWSSCFLDVRCKIPWWIEWMCESGWIPITGQI